MRFLSVPEIQKSQLLDSKSDAAFPNGPEVLALGLPRCATSSVQEAFEQHLSLSPSLHFAYILPHLPRLRTFVGIFDLSPYLNSDRNAVDAAKQQRQALIHSLYEGFRSACDVPTPLVAEDVIEMYPDAKLVLNLRPGRTAEEAANSWRNSFQEAIGYQRSWWFGLVTYLWPNDRLLHGLHAQLQRIMINQSDGVVTQGLNDVKVYQWHTEHIRRLAKAHNRPLLEWDPAQGWEPLCEFLGRELPKDENGKVKPFPKSNDMRTMKILKVIFLARGVLMWVILGAAVCLPYWLLKTFR